MYNPLVTRCRVPADLASVTTVRHDAEVDPRTVGVGHAAPAHIWRAVERLYASGMHPAIQLCVRRRGQVIVDRAIGHAAGNGPADPPDARRLLCTAETPFNIFSASKAVTAMLVHLLDQRNLIRVDDPVCEYIPEFAPHNKQWITIRHLLSHRAGIPNLPPEGMNLDELHRPERMLELLCDLKPMWRAGRQLAYHAITGGFLLGEVVRRVTGKDIRTLLTETIRTPLGLRWMNYGVGMRDLNRVAVNYFTGPPPVPPLSTILARALGVEFREACRLSNDPRFLTAIVPSGNIVATADELCRFYQVLLNGGDLDGVAIFEPRTIRRATLEQSYWEMDFTLGIPFRYTMGFTLGADWLSVYGPDTRHAFGHLGFTNIVAWADPERQLAVALMTSGKPLVYPQIYYVWDIARQIGLLCPKDPRHRTARPAVRAPRPQARHPTRPTRRQVPRHDGGPAPT